MFLILVNIANLKRPETVMHYKLCGKVLWKLISLAVVMLVILAGFRHLIRSVGETQKFLSELLPDLHFPSIPTDGIKWSRKTTIVYTNPRVNFQPFSANEACAGIPPSLFDGGDYE